MGDNQARLEDIGPGRVEAMDAAGIHVSILSVVTPATQALPAREAIALARDANDEATDAVRAHPARFRAFATLPTSDPQAAAAELERCATQLGHVGAMIHGRTGTRTLDDPAYDDLFATAARLHQPIFIHPQIPSNELRDAAYRGLDPLIDLGLASFGWGWHMDAGLSALRLILRGTFDRYPDLQLVLGHWGEVLLFWSEFCVAAYHKSPPVNMYRNGTSGMRPKIPHASFPPGFKSGRSVARSIHIRTTARGCRKQTRISRSFFMT
jgi:hypothetical protein